MLVALMASEVPARRSPFEPLSFGPLGWLLPGEGAANRQVSVFMAFDQGQGVLPFREPVGDGAPPQLDQSLRRSAIDCIEQVGERVIRHRTVDCRIQ